MRNIKKLLNRLISLITILSIICIILSGCQKANQRKTSQAEPTVHESQAQFLAKIIEISDSHVLVEPIPGEEELRSCNRITFSIEDLESIQVRVGSIVEITYSGTIMETYPAQINAVTWKLVKDLRNLKYTDQWVNKTDETKTDNDIFTDIIISRIYSNCFFANTVAPAPFEIKLNAVLSDQWCVGDQVKVTYENTYYDLDTQHIEADLLTIRESTLDPGEFVCYKPVIYLYPETKTSVEITVSLTGKLTCTYPKYENGWKVLADPDGTLYDKCGQTYRYLYWEGDIYTKYELSKGFCIKGEDTAIFLEQVLEQLGLNRQEANEFIVYWLPLMEKNPYNIITFQTQAYTDAAKLQITPTPDTLIRVFMVWKGINEYIELEKPILTAPDRKGFTVVEWGGTEIP